MIPKVISNTRLKVCRPIVVTNPTLTRMSDSLQEPARKVFARNLRKCRTKNGLSQERLADLTGLHRTYVGSVERGERNVSIDNMERFALALNVPLPDLLRVDGT